MKYITHPSLVEEWSTENGMLTPYNTTAGSNKVIFWNCNQCGNKWRTSIYSRTKLGKYCHLCMCKNPQ